MTTDLREKRCQLVAAVQAAAAACAEAPLDRECSDELDAALAALFDFDSRHPELAERFVVIDLG